MSKVGRTTIILMIFTILSKLFGFVRELVLTYVYGASNISDVYITSMSIPTILFASVVAAISTTFIPLFYKIERLDSKQKALDFTNNIFNIVLIIGIIVIFFTFMFTEEIVKLFAMNFKGYELSLAIKFTRIMIVGVIFIGMSTMMTAWLHINNEFKIPGMVGYLFNISIIMGIIISSKGNLNIMAIGTLIGMGTQFLIQLPFAIKYGFKYRLKINFKDKYLSDILKLIIPVFIGVGVNQINFIVDKSLASTLNEGTITVLNSANRLNAFVLGIFISTIASVIYPILSKLSNENNKKIFSQIVSKSINSAVVLIIPISVGAIILSKPIVRIVFERGAFDSQATSMTAIALACYSIGTIGFGLREILNKIFYSIQDTKTPMINGAFVMIINIVLSIILIKFLGYIGIALATSISSLICIVVLFNTLKKKIEYFREDKIIKTTLKSLVSSIVMAVVTHFMYNTLANVLLGGFIQDAVALFGAICMGAIVYCVLVIVLKVEEVSIVINMIKNKITVK